MLTEDEGTTDAVDEEDVTRPATASAALDPAVAAQAEAASDPNRAVERLDAAAEPPRPARLRRVAPEQVAGEFVELANEGNVLGRSHTCNIQLFSPTASRQHAQIMPRDGEWILSPAGSKPVFVEGHPVFSETQLRHESRIQLGADELVFQFLQEKSDSEDSWHEEETYVSAATGEVPTPAHATGPGWSPIVWIVGSVVGAVLAGLAFWLLL